MERNIIDLPVARKIWVCVMRYHLPLKNVRGSFTLVVYVHLFGVRVREMYYFCYASFSTLLVFRALEIICWIL